MADTNTHHAASLRAHPISSLPEAFSASLTRLSPYSRSILILLVRGGGRERKQQVRQEEGVREGVSEGGKETASKIGGGREGGSE